MQEFSCGTICGKSNQIAKSPVSCNACSIDKKSLSCSRLLQKGTRVLVSIEAALHVFRGRGPVCSDNQQG